MPKLINTRQLRKDVRTLFAEHGLEYKSMSVKHVRRENSDEESVTISGYSTDEIQGVIEGVEAEA